MATKRTTLIVDEHADAAEEVPKHVREQRVKALERLFELFEGHDAAEEVRRLKSEDQGL
jgi:hypothetical protein